jgi:hypothetical protein
VNGTSLAIEEGWYLNLMISQECPSEVRQREEKGTPPEINNTEEDGLPFFNAMDRYKENSVEWPILLVLQMDLSIKSKISHHL